MVGFCGLPSWRKNKDVSRMGHPVSFIAGRRRRWRTGKKQGRDLPMVGLCGLPPIEQKTLDGWGTVSSAVGRLRRWGTDKKQGRDLPMVGLCGLPPIEQKTLDGWGTVSSRVGRLRRWRTDRRPAPASISAPRGDWRYDFSATYAKYRLSALEKMRSALLPGRHAARDLCCRRRYGGQHFSLGRNRVLAAGLRAPAPAPRPSSRQSAASCCS